jgi:hypothetical protein
LRHSRSASWRDHDLPFVPKSVIASLTDFTVGFITTGVPPDIGTVCKSGANVEEPAGVESGSYLGGLLSGLLGSA